MRDTEAPSPEAMLARGAGYTRAAAAASPTPRRVSHILEPETRRPESTLGVAIVEIVRQVLRSELQAYAAAEAAPRSPWMTPPAASRATGIPVKTIRAWARAERIPKRIKNRAADPKQQKYLVNVDDVVAVAEQVAGEPVETSDKLELQKRAEERAAEVLAARAAARGR